MADDRPREMEEAWFHLSGHAPVLKGFHEYWMRWKGHARPRFERNAVQKLMAWVNSGPGSARWDDQVIVIALDEQGIESRWPPGTTRFDGYDYATWAPGDASWVWADIEKPWTGEVLAFCPADAQHDKFNTITFLRMETLADRHGAARFVMRSPIGLAARMAPEAGLQAVFDGGPWKCATCGIDAAILYGTYPCELTAEQQYDIDTVIGGKMDNSHDAGGPDMELHEAAAVVVSDCVHYIQGVLEDAACCYDNAEAVARWPEKDADVYKLPIVEYVRGRYFGLFNTALLP